MKYKWIVFLVLLFLLCSQSIQQSKGKSKGKKKRKNTGGYTPNPSTKQTKGISSCSSRCKPDDLQCRQKCAREAKLVGGIVGGILGGLVLAIGTGFGCWWCKGKCQAKEQQHTQGGKGGVEGSQDTFDKMGDCFEGRFNVVETNLMVEEEFKAKRDEILYWFNNKGAEVPSNFAYVQAGVPTPVVVSTSIVEERSFLTKVALNGNDSVGAWTGTGYILCRKKPTQGQIPQVENKYQIPDGVEIPEIFFWFQKKYNDQSLQEISQSQNHLIYQSIAYFQGVSMQGKWYFSRTNKEDTDHEDTGRWLIINGNSYPNFYNVPCHFINKKDYIDTSTLPIDVQLSNNPINKCLTFTAGQNQNILANTGIHGNINEDLTANCKENTF